MIIGPIMKKIYMFLAINYIYRLRVITKYFDIVKPRRYQYFNCNGSNISIELENKIKKTISSLIKFQSYNRLSLN